MGKSEYISQYRRYIGKKILFIAVCTVLSFVALGLGLSIGKYNIGFFESYAILWNHISGNLPTDEIGIMKDHVIWNLRFPRAIAGMAVGAGLAVCGTAMQSSMKNPLADPYTTGISSGASLGATLAIVSGFSLISGTTLQTSIVINAFAFSLIPALIMIVISTMKRGISPASTILIGVAVMYVFSASTMLLKVTATEDTLADAYTWGVGTLGKASWGNILPMIVAALTGIIIFTAMANKLNILAMDDKNVAALGEHPKRLRTVMMLIVSVVTAILVSYTGTIGFVGLVVPHIVRIFIGSDNRYLVPASASFGALFLVCADSVAKEMTTTGLPVGIVTALIGGPMFFLILLRMGKKIW